ncbi:MAG TPA: protein-tyrosine phosphatase family protein, partial [Ignavibacteriaceae bacterium]
MIASVFFLSRSQAESYSRKKQPRPFAIISITDTGSKPANIPRTHQGLIRLEFEDLYEEVYGECKVGQIPDMLPDSLPLIVNGEEWPDANHAKKILSFIETVSKKEQEMDLVVHCEGGISRSAAVAQFVADR